MFRLLKSLFRRTKHTAAPAPAAVADTASSAASNRAPETSSAVPRVETAQLSLIAVMSRFPDDLRKLVLKMPPQDAMVVLPLPTIQKMLPTGSVKMSLASVVRQAPPGTFSTINPQDKRLVEVPLAEIFKRISPALLKKRPDQKLTELAAEGFDIFGDEENPHALAPKVEGAPGQPAAPAPAPTLGAGPAKVLKVPAGMVTAPPPTVPVTAKAAQQSEPAALPKPARLPKAPAATPKAAPASAPAAVPEAPAPEPAVATVAAPTADEQPPLVISLKEISSAWPEPIKSEAAALNGVTVSLPAGELASGLAKGKVAFGWGQLRSWMTPPPSTQSEAGDATELVLPLRVIAPAFLKHTKGGGPARKAGAVGDIPELFAGKNAPAKTTPPAPAPEPVPEAKAPKSEPPAPQAVPEAPVETPAVEPAVEAKAEPKPAPAAAEPPAEPVQNEAKPGLAQSAPAAEAAPVETPSAEPAAAAEEPAAPAALAHAEAEAAAPAAPVSPAVAPLPQSLGELFGQPGKSTWSPTEVVNQLAALPGIAGAVVALQEGLVIAHKLPEPLKGEIFAAFLPQVFARLNQYSGEMKLGGVDEITIQTEAGPCHLFRRGQVFFAALGAAESAVPLHNLRLCAEAVAG